MIAFMMNARRLTICRMNSVNHAVGKCILPSVCLQAGQESRVVTPNAGRGGLAGTRERKELTIANFRTFIPSL